MKKNKKLIIIITAVIVVAGIVFAILEKTDTIDVFKSGRVQNNDDKDAKTTSKAKTAQDDFNEGTDRDPTTPERNEGMVTDNNGNVGSIPPESQWTTSQTGVITLYAPAKNSVVKKGNTISGKSTASAVSYRLIDDVTGVIAQGQLTVSNGQFSGTFDFNTTASEGRLDLFTTYSDDGTESNNIEVPIRFK